MGTTILVNSQDAARINTAGSFQSTSLSDSTATVIPSTEKLLEDILSVTGLQPSFTLQEAHVLNIEASISHKERFILYNPSFINQINNITRDKWATLTLLAHEIGHHLNGHTLRKGGSSPALELEADEFAGFVLYKLGATLQQAQKVMKYIAKPVASSTHPSREDRMQAISKGWHRN
ncbi:MAG TPA: M48 family metalloprotease [Chitinophagaceae bacterium]|nr:M48 family metalloprotease [Chitinophagaceae bacterium]